MVHYEDLVDSLKTRTILEKKKSIKWKKRSFVFWFFLLFVWFFLNLQSNISRSHFCCNTQNRIYGRAIKICYIHIYIISLMTDDVWGKCAVRYFSINTLSELSCQQSSNYDSWNVCGSEVRSEVVLKRKIMRQTQSSNLKRKTACQPLGNIFAVQRQFRTNKVGLTAKE